MDKGIRPAAIAMFATLLATRVNTREGNTVFRKGVIAHLEEEFGITHAAGATHYNHAFIDAKKKAETDVVLAALLVGLGRPEDKKGGRKPKAKAETKASVIPTPVNVLLQNFINAGIVQGPQQPAQQAAVETAQAEETAEVETPQGDVPSEQTVFAVRKKSDDSVVAEGLSFDEAKALIDAAAKAKKAKLYWV
jgi:hypothetical protein